MEKRLRIHASDPRVDSSVTFKGRCAWLLHMVHAELLYGWLEKESPYGAGRGIGRELQIRYSSLDLVTDNRGLVTLGLRRYRPIREVLVFKNWKAVPMTKSQRFSPVPSGAVLSSLPPAQPRLRFVVDHSSIDHSSRGRTVYEM